MAVTSLTFLSIDTKIWDSVKICVLFLAIKTWFENRQITLITLMKATERYLPVVLFIMLYMMFLTFDYVDEILGYDNSIESY